MRHQVLLRVILCPNVNATLLSSTRIQDDCMYCFGKEVLQSFAKEGVPSKGPSKKKITLKNLIGNRRNFEFLHQQKSRNNFGGQK